MSFKAKVKDQNTGQIDTKLTNVKLLKCPFIDDCILKERISLIFMNFRIFLIAKSIKQKKHIYFAILKNM